MLVTASCVDTHPAGTVAEVSSLATAAAAVSDQLAHTMSACTEACVTGDAPLACFVPFLAALASFGTATSATAVSIARCVCGVSLSAFLLEQVV